jgi:signal peptidase II
VWGAAALVVVLDRLTKVWAERSLADGPVDLIEGVLTLRFTTNPGGAFSLFTSVPWFFVIAAVAVSVVIGVLAFRERPILQSVALGMILGGALGNLIDRVTRGPGLSGEVVDFVDLHIWPVFNVADAAIVVGAIVLAIASVRGSREVPVDAA